MLRWIREEWEMVSFRARILVPGILLAVLLVFAGLVWALNNWQGDVDLPSGSLAEESRESGLSLEEALPDTASVPKMGVRERRILENHFKAVGGVERLASINSLLSSGDLSFPDGTVRPIVVVKKQGNRIRFSIEVDNGQMVMVATPEDSWRCFWRDGRLVMVEDLDARLKAQLQRSAYVVSELYLAMQNSWTVNFVGDKAFNYEMAHCFEVKVDDKNLIRFFIDPDSYLDVGREDWNFDEEGNLTITRIVGADHMDIAGLKVPGKYDLYENNVLKQTFTTRDVEVNPGILGKTFERPKLAAAD